MPSVVLGVVLARCPRHSAGHTCAIMNWALGFREAGWEVFLVEALAEEELTFTAENVELSDQRVFWDATVKEFGFEQDSCLFVEEKSPEADRFSEFAARADCFLNYSGQFAPLHLLPSSLPKAYLDVDPFFTQVWAAAYGCDMNFTGHDVFFSVGLNLGLEGFRLPDTGRFWHPSPPPLPAASWRSRLPKSGGPDAEGAWSTVGHWYGYSDVEWQGMEIGGKRKSFLGMKDLPLQAEYSKFAIATDLEKDWGDLEEFQQTGWRFFSVAEVCKDVPSYLAFLRSSRGEIGIAKTGYVNSRCGWISDRSLVYLALGRPVLLQDTGWHDAFPANPGLGMSVFSSPQDCVRKLRELEGCWQEASASASHIAETIFAPNVIVGKLAERILE